MKTKNLIFHDFKNLSIVEFETDDMAALNVFPAGYYIEKGLCRVAEQKDEQVGNVFVINESEDYLLFTDMDILSGAKQSRVVNISTLVRPHSKSNLEVSCVEQHRWEPGKRDFHSSTRTIEPDIRREKIFLISSHEKDVSYKNKLQYDIWNKVGERIAGRGEENPTSSYEKYLESTQQEPQALKNLQPNFNSNGLAIISSGTLQYLEVFGNTALYQHYFNRVLEHFLRNVNDEKKDVSNVKDLQKIIDKSLEVSPSIPLIPGRNGIGKLRVIPETGFELSFEGEMVHKVVFDGLRK